MLKKSQSTKNIPRVFAGKIKIGIVRSVFNSEMTESLEDACRKTLLKAGVQEKNITTTTVPGALEIPITAQTLAKKKRYDVLIALGVVFKGDTYHFELVANESARGCMDVSLKWNIPIICQILSVYNMQQAKARTGNNGFNKGIEAAHGALAIASTLQDINRKHA
ncbi:MAG: 6,7-dimethyl-8-ribityllumazine synthase [Candidatus Pacebacteria bacterium]|nr:6,7-dimethyl-8-ribityllumazine synthase [Candidatus Paceibacterota bacterium]MDD5356868.1 6,7-dimethyl-8-ribityllumazine synthase [Candidatus Paceibacterota bacterium]